MTAPGTDDLTVTESPKGRRQWYFRGGLVSGAEALRLFIAAGKLGGVHTLTASYEARLLLSCANLRDLPWELAKSRIRKCKNAPLLQTLIAEEKRYSKPRAQVILAAEKRIEVLRGAKDLQNKFDGAAR